MTAIKIMRFPDINRVYSFASLFATRYLAHRVWLSKALLERFNSNVVKASATIRKAQNTLAICCYSSMITDFNICEPLSDLKV